MQRRRYHTLCSRRASATPSRETTAGSDQREVSPLILTESEQNALKETVVEEHQPDLGPLALENQKQRTAEREAPNSSTTSSTISICGGERCIIGFRAKKKTPRVM